MRSGFWSTIVDPEVRWDRNGMGWLQGVVMSEAKKTTGGDGSSHNLIRRA